MMNEIEVYTECEDLLNDAKALAKRLQIPLRETSPEEGHHELILELRPEGLFLTADGLSMQGDLSTMISRIKKSKLQTELLVKAAKKKESGSIPLAIDATAGMGEDALILAAAGYRVKLYEYDPIIAALLEDSLKRAAQIPELAAIVGRMEVAGGNSIAAMSAMTEEEERPEVILLDPMFPERSKSGLIKKKFQLLQRLESPCSDEADLLRAAISANPQKILIKRPAKGPFLAGIKPSHSLKGKAIRYDVLINVAQLGGKL